MASEGLESVAGFIRAHEVFAVSGHVHPDGDCIGSILAATSLLRRLGKRATPVLANSSHPPIAYSFLEGFGDFIHSTAYEGDLEALLSVDTPNRERMGDTAELAQRASHVAMIDHHPSCGFEAEASHIDVTAASASMIVWDLAKLMLDDSPGQAIAQACYTGLLTDTGSFQFQNVDGRAFAAASEMVAQGASPSFVAANAMQNKPMGVLRMQARVIERTRVTPGGKVAYSWHTKDDFDELRVAKDQTEGLIDSVRAVEGCVVALLIQGRKNDVRCSIRSKSDFDISGYARSFAGGGHKAASGFTVRARFEDAMPGLERLAERIESDVVEWQRACEAGGGATGGAPCVNPADFGLSCGEIGS